LMISAEDVLEEFEVDDEAPPLESEDESEDESEGIEEHEGNIKLPSGMRLVAEYANGDMEVLGEEGEAGLPTSVADMAVLSFRGHKGPIYAVAINPRDSRSMLTGGGDDRAFFWETTAAAPSVNTSTSMPGLGAVKESEDHGESVNAVGYSHDGSLAATGAYSGKVLVWDAKTRGLLQTLEGPEDVEWLQWHPKGNLLLAGSKDGTVWMWLAVTGECMRVFSGHEDAVTVGMFTSDGKLVVSGSMDGSVRVWGPKAGVCRHVFSGYAFHEGPVTALASHPSDGALLLSGGMDGTARLLHAAGKRVLASMVHSEPTAVGNGGGGASVNGRDKEGGKSEGGVAPMEEDGTGPGTEEEVAGEEVHEGNYSVETVGFSSVLNWCATGGMDGTMKIWDLGNFSCRHVCVHPGLPGVTKLQWHASLPLIYTAATDGVLRLWDARSGALLQAMTGHEDMILDFAVHSADGHMDVVLTGSDDGTAKVFWVDVQRYLQQSCS